MTNYIYKEGLSLLFIILLMCFSCDGNKKNTHTNRNKAGDPLSFISPRYQVVTDRSGSPSLAYGDFNRDNLRDFVVLLTSSESKEPVVKVSVYLQGPKDSYTEMTSSKNLTNAFLADHSTPKLAFSNKRITLNYENKDQNATLSFRYDRNTKDLRLIKSELKKAVNQNDALQYLLINKNFITGHCSIDTLSYSEYQESSLIPSDVNRRKIHKEKVFLSQIGWENISSIMSCSN